MAHIVLWVRQMFCKHEFEFFKQGVHKSAHDARWKYKPTWVINGYWKTYICKKCLFKHNVNTH